jgi:PAS domain S-box-containing protein
MSYDTRSAEASVIEPHADTGSIALHSLLDAVSESAVLVDLEGRIVFANQTAAARLGASRKGLVGLDLLSLIPEDVGNARLQYANLALAAGKPVHFEDQRQGMRFRNSIHPVFDDRGAVSHLAIFSADITSNCHEREEYARLSLLNKALLDNIPDLIVTIDRTGIVLAINQSIGDRDRESLTGANLYEILDKRYHAEARRLFDEAFASGKRREFVRQAHIWYGKRWLEVRVIPIASAKTVAAVTCIVRDITETREAQIRLERKNVALREIIEHIEEEKNAVHQEVANHIETRVMPLVKKMKISGEQRVYADMLEQGLSECVTPKGRTASLADYRLTPREVEICDMIKLGLSTKEIARHSHASPQTVEKQRKTIRKKLGLDGKSSNLAAFLRQR